MRAPEFWQGDGGVWPLLLAPLAHVYGAGAAARHALTEPVSRHIRMQCWREAVDTVYAGGNPEH